MFPLSFLSFSYSANSYLFSAEKFNTVYYICFSISARYLRVVDLRTYNPNLKIILQIGGYNTGSTPFQYVSRDNDSRALFAEQTIRFLRERKFDGLDMDWYYLTADYKVQYRLLMQVITTRKHTILNLKVSMSIGEFLNVCYYYQVIYFEDLQFFSLGNFTLV